MEGDRCAFVINCQHLCSYIAVVLCTPSVRSVLALVCSVLSLDKSGIDTLTPLFETMGTAGAEHLVFEHWE